MIRAQAVNQHQEETGHTSFVGVMDSPGMVS